LDGLEQLVVLQRVDGQLDFLGPGRRFGVIRDKCRRDDIAWIWSTCLWGRGDSLGRGASASALETIWVSAAADGPAGQREAAFRFELNMIVVAEAPVVKVAAALVPITETPVVKSARNDE
jgi:hypothetical protein